MCEIAIDLMRDGASKHEVAYELGISYQSLLNFEKEHPEFFDAINFGKGQSYGWWLKQGRTNLGNKHFNYYGWQKQMANRFRDMMDEPAVKLPALRRAETYSDKINTILYYVRRGKITPSEGKRLAETIAIGAKVEETTELEKRIAMLEGVADEKHTA